ncbi:MAG: iron ABC transporter permease [Clostridium cochlearium]|uniref:Iron ABC transporter permease n=1 Tax=Clostridium cochlearium TaxID=1494 RepID=A0A7Y3XZJ1_CLOCO|nr:iron ABC transporter permease [Clostridium cochlearium]MCR1970759.1 iron ABC transporter permease [Clostridium cochlearium]MDU1443444.1 iron ABC transporter permease [Clostridium cochlearium]NOH16767.1 iron ABC transporter permease [Clostridium cochlearium]
MISNLKMYQKKDTKFYKINMIVVFIALAVIAFFISNIYGSMDISIKDIIQILKNPSNLTPEGLVIWNVRIPRTIVGVLVGINLSISGAMLQGVMRNPLADPGIIGISSGAGLAGIMILIIFPQYQYLVPPFAFLGAMIAAIMIYTLAWKDGIQPMRVVLAGVAVSAILGAGISALMVFFSSRVHGALMFMNGGLSAKSWPEVYMILPYTIVGFMLALIMAQRLNILVLGDDTARGLGLNVELVRLEFTVVAAMLAGSAVSVVGLLGFVGLIIPHTVRLILGSDYKYLFPASAFLGAAVVVFCDTFGRTIFAPVEIPVGIIMALLGAPFFLYLLRKQA